MQAYTSATTSINQRTPAAYRLIPAEAWEGTTVYDHGCGRYPEYGIKYAMGAGARRVVCYDKYNLPGGEAREDVRRRGGADITIISNVLNVVDNAEARADCLREAARYTGGRGTIYVTVYEGDGSGRGRATGADAWQENRRTGDYVKEIGEALPAYKVTRRGKLIIIKKEVAR